jgi:hypothetical protein
MNRGMWSSYRGDMGGFVGPQHRASSLTAARERDIHAAQAESFHKKPGICDVYPPVSFSREPALRDLNRGLVWWGMNKILRISLIVIVVLGLLLGIGLGIGSWWIMRKMGPDMWVKLSEEKWNCRMQISDAELSLLSRPARLKFQDVKMAPRDAEVLKEPSERTPMAEGTALITIPEIVLEVKLDDLLNKRLFIEKLRIVSPVVQESQTAQGESTLEALFQKAAGGEEVPKAIPVQQTAATAAPSTPPAQGESDFAFAISTASLENGSLTIKNPGVQILVRELDFSLSGIDVDPQDLAAHNKMRALLSGHLQVSGMARIGGVMRPTEMANLKLTGESDIVPIDPISQKWAPSSTLKLTLDQGSVLAGHMTMGDAAGKEMKKLMEYGVDLSPVKIGGPLMEPAVMQASFRNNRLTLLKDTRFAFPEYEVMIEGQSWFNSTANQHDMDLRLACGGALQARLQAGVSKAKLGESIARGVMKALSDDRGRMTFDIESEGSLSDPKIRPRIDRLLKNLIKGEGLGDLLQGLLKKL